MATHLGGMPPVYHMPRAAGSPVTSNEAAQTRLVGPKGAAVSADPVRGAPEAAKKSFMDFLARRGEAGEYAKLTSLTGD